MAPVDDPPAAQKFLEKMLDSGLFESNSIRDLKVLSVSPGFCKASLPVTPKVANRYGTLHGGCIATLVDVVGSAALVTASSLSGVSVEISTSYIGPAKVGEEVLVEARLLKQGRSLAVIQVDLTVSGTGARVAQGRHTKFLPGTPHNAGSPNLTSKL
mmetsp:Transcript_18359/g.59761  ORF Transcript_18359/g.59761 Transcript_18359/m.59761 type:complete len:157 (+) Transcript_18359:2-472(+)